VYDYAGNLVTGLEQRCPAAGCFNELNIGNFADGMIKLRIRMYLISVNNSVIDAVQVTLVRIPVFVESRNPHTGILQRHRSTASTLRTFRSLPGTTPMLRAPPQGHVPISSQHTLW
jgi:hypothetical protein